MMMYLLKSCDVFIFFTLQSLFRPSVQDRVDLHGGVTPAVSLDRSIVTGGPGDLVVNATLLTRTAELDLVVLGPELDFSRTLHELNSKVYAHFTRQRKIVVNNEIKRL